MGIMRLAGLAFGSCLAVLPLAAALADAPGVPNGKPLSEAEIKELLDGRSFEFVAYDEPLKGTNEWDFDKGVVSGSYVWDGTHEGTYEIEMFIENDQLCTVQEGKGTVCQIVYRHEDGFMEVTPKGVVHSVSKPMN